MELALAIYKVHTEKFRELNKVRTGQDVACAFGQGLSSSFLIVQECC
jgi:hypothetical protein